MDVIIGLGWQPTQLLSLLSSTRQGGNVGWKSLCVEIKTGKSLTCYCQKQNRVWLEKLNLIYCQLKSQHKGEKQR